MFVAGEVEAADLQSYLNDRLARFEVPRYIRIVREPLPRTASGKVLKREIKLEAIAELGL